ncbi:MAG: bifunctional diguanylate cyclase/phosphodiesterase [Synergistaceae bacterium]|nr:bifunctional diguanylate cyclase/phosphodiesterase [Synergistaceae bacterium]
MNSVDIFKAEALWLLDDYPEGVYVSELTSHRLVYMNNVCRRLFGIAPDADIGGESCYKTLHGYDSPCAFCRPECLSENRYHVWEHDNNLLGKHVVLRDRLIRWNGRDCRLQTISVAESGEQLRQLVTSKIHTENTLLECIDALANQSGPDGVEKSVDKILEVIGSFYFADRAYVLELEPSSTTLRRTYEWLRDGVPAESDRVTDVNLSPLRQKCHSERTPMIIKDIEMLREGDPAEYERQKKRGVHAIYCVPYESEGKMRGCVGVDNPTLNMGNFSMLKTLALLVSNQIDQYRLRSRQEYAIYHDALTGLRNRNSYNHYRSGLEEEKLRRVGVAVGNLNSLDRQNRDFGVENGDGVVKLAATILQKHFSKDMLFRFEGDEFIVVCENISFQPFIKRVEEAEREISEKTLCGITTGHTWAEEDIMIGAMVNTAKRHMVEKKKLYYASKDEDSRYNSKQILENLKANIAAGNFLIYIQPKINLSDGSLHGAEALIRYSSQEYGIIPPGKFIPLIEKEGLIRYIDFFVLETVCGLIAKWLAAGIEPPVIALNFSRATLLESGISESVDEVVEKYGIPRKYIYIEITESAGRMEKDTFVSIGRLLMERGFELSLDDFCSEYSCVSLLSALKFAEIKFDRSMIAQLGGEDRTADIICEMMMGLCASLGLPVIAEGVETEEQLAILKNFRCDAVQGFLFDRPLPVAEFEKKYLSAKE